MEYIVKEPYDDKLTSYLSAFLKTSRIMRGHIKYEGMRQYNLVYICAFQFEDKHTQMSNQICKTISINLHAIVCQCFNIQTSFSQYSHDIEGQVRECKLFSAKVGGWPVDYPHKGPVTRKCSYLMTPSWVTGNYRFLSCILGNALRFCAVSHLKRVAPRIWLVPDIYNVLYFQQRDIDLSERKDMQHFY